MRNLFKNTIYSLTLISIFSCINNYKFPEKIQNPKSKKHTRLEGSSIFLDLPKEYKYDSEMGIYKKNNETYIQYIDQKTAYSKITKSDLEQKGLTIENFTEISVNNLEGIYMYSPSENYMDNQLGLFFGNDKSNIFVTGTFNKNDESTKKELQAIFESIYYDTNLKVDYSKYQSFTFNQSITNYKYTSGTVNIFVYNENRISSNQILNSFMFAKYPIIPESKSAIFASNMLIKHKENGMIIEDDRVVMSTINNYKSYITESKFIYGNQEGIIYQVLLIGENQSLMFTATAIDNLESNLIKFRKTAKTIKLK